MSTLAPTWPTMQVCCQRSDVLHYLIFPQSGTTEAREAPHPKISLHFISNRYWLRWHPWRPFITFLELQWIIHTCKVNRFTSLWTKVVGRTSAQHEVWTSPLSASGPSLFYTIVIYFPLITEKLNERGETYGCGTRAPELLHLPVNILSHVLYSNFSDLKTATGHYRTVWTCWAATTSTKQSLLFELLIILDHITSCDTVCTASCYSISIIFI